MKAFFIACATISALAVGSTAWTQDIPAEYQQALTTLGKQGDYKAKVLKVNIPRNDVNVTVANVKTPTPFGFGGWVAMAKGTGGMDVMMGDLVLLQDEVNPVMSALLANGLDVTAIHNHFFWDEPRMFYMHVHGHGKAADLARQVKPALDLIGKGTSGVTLAIYFAEVGWSATAIGLLIGVASALDQAILPQTVSADRRTWSGGALGGAAPTLLMKSMAVAVSSTRGIGRDGRTDPAIVRDGRGETSRTDVRERSDECDAERRVGSGTLRRGSCDATRCARRSAGDRRRPQDRMRPHALQSVPSCAASGGRAHGVHRNERYWTDDVNRIGGFHEGFDTPHRDAARSCRATTNGEFR